MNVSEDRRYSRDAHIRVDEKFEENLRKLQELTGIKTNSKAIRYAVEWVVTGLTAQDGSAGGPRLSPEKAAAPDIPDDIRRRIKNTGSAEEIRLACVEIQLLAEEGRKQRYLTEDQYAHLMAYLRELSKMTKELLGLGER